MITRADGLTRGAVVEVASSVGRSTVLRHPLQLLYPLEVHKCDGDAMPITNEAQATDTANNDYATTAVSGSEPLHRSNHVASRTHDSLFNYKAKTTSSQSTEPERRSLLHVY